MSRSHQYTNNHVWDSTSILTSLVRHLPVAIFAVDATGRILEANEAAGNLLGSAQPDLDGESLTKMLGPTFERYYRLSNADPSDNGIRQFECAVRLQGGSPEIVSVTLLPASDEDDQIHAHVVLQILDGESELARMLHVSQRGLNAIFNSGATGIIFFDLDGQIIETNPALQQMLAYGADTLREMNIIELVHTADRLLPDTSDEDPFADLVAGIRNHYWAVRRYIHHDGHLIWAQVTVSAVRDDAGTILYFISMMQDVTERKMLEDVAVIANETRASLSEALGMIVEELAVQVGFEAAHVLLVHEQSNKVVPTGIWYLSSPDMLPNYCALTSGTTFSPGAGHVGRVFASRVATLDRNLPASSGSLRIAAAIDDGLRTGLFVPMIIHNDVVGVIEFYSTEDRHVDPGLLDTLTRIAPQLGWLVERERAREALQIKSAELERSNRDLDRFASVASHDLQEPLRAIGRSTRLLQERYGAEFGDDAEQLFHFIADGAERMEALISDLLRYSRIRTSADEHIPVNLNEVVGDVLQDLQVVIGENQATLKVDDLPTVYGNSTQLHQVFQNLIGNALKYRSDNSPVIEIEAKENGAVWTFSVKDNGIGIDPAFHTRIFDIFRRLHARDEYSGTGIGLAIVKRIIEQHHGDLWVESTEANGSTFFFTLPMLRGAQTRHGNDPTTENRTAG